MISRMRMRMRMRIMRARGNVSFRNVTFAGLRLLKCSRSKFRHPTSPGAVRERGADLKWSGVRHDAN
jgi:hypothetical protein